MDDYLVRLGRAPQPPPAEIEARPVGELRVRPHRTRRGFAVLAVLGLLAYFNRATALDWLGAAADKVKDPVTALEGDTQLEDANDALNVQWRLAGSYPASVDVLKAIDPSVAWGDVVRYEQCAGGQSAVLIARTAHGTVSRLVVRGSERDAEGERHCPPDPLDSKSWGL
ncbi:MAG: hypothetical protein HYU28_02160 [Actinobacteria bacterium]|nr:hypothetical protein [Actinomycetota bacterium]